MDSDIKWLILRICLDVLSVILVFLPFFVLELGIEPYHRGFFCDDNSIHYPYKDDTVTTLVITLVGLIVPISVVIVTEIIRHFWVKKKTLIAPSVFRITSTCSIPHHVVCAYKVVGIFLFGCAVSQSITNVAKFTIGRLRPHFLAVCKPDAKTYNCTNSNNFFVYIEKFDCLGTDEHLLVDARLSFPSGHSSMASYSAVFLMLYLQARFTWSGSKLLRHLTQAVCVYGAVFVCLSRVSDYKHHPGDVLGGAVLGTFVAALTSLHIFSMSQMSDKVIENGRNDDAASSGFMLPNRAPVDHQTHIFATP